MTCDDNLSTNTSTPTSLKNQDVESPGKDVGFKKRNSKSLPMRNDGTLDYDGEFTRLQ